MNNKPNMQALIFDVGGVLLRTVHPERRAQWETRLGLPAGAVHDLVFLSEAGQAAQRGEIDDAALWAWVGDQLGLSEADRHQFYADFWAADEVNTALLAWIAARRARYQTAIISNFSAGLRQMLTVTHPQVGALFDVIVISAEEKVTKPTPEIYQRTLARLGQAAHETMFVDDNEENVHAARDLGIYAIHYHPSVDIDAALAQWGQPERGSEHHARYRD